MYGNIIINLYLHVFPLHLLAHTIMIYMLLNVSIMVQMFTFIICILSFSPSVVPESSCESLEKQQEELKVSALLFTSSVPCTCILIQVKTCLYVKIL